MSFSARQLTETAVTLITSYLQTNMASALSAVSSVRTDNLVSLEAPVNTSYFIAPKQHGYQCPAVFVIDDNTDFRQSEQKANFIDAMMTIKVTVKVEDQDTQLLTLKAWRYQAALHSLLDQTPIVSGDSKVKILSKVRRITPSGIYSYANSESDETAGFFKEYELQLEVDYFENF